MEELAKDLRRYSSLYSNKILFLKTQNRSVTAVEELSNNVLFANDFILFLDFEAPAFAATKAI